MLPPQNILLGKSSKNHNLSIELKIPWVESPFFERELERSSLDSQTKELVRHFSEEGYIIIEPKIENFERISEDIICELPKLYGENTRVQDAWQFDRQVKTLAVAPQVLEILRLLYKREPIPFQTLNFPVGTQQATHSDTIHFHSVPARFMCGVWFALEDVDEYNGLLHYYPKSHKLPILTLQDLGLRTDAPGCYNNYQIYEQFIAEWIDIHNLEKIDVKLSKGQALIWAANLLHGGSPILDCNRTRHSQVTHYFFSDCMYYTPLHSEVFLGNVFWRNHLVNIATGKPVSQFYLGDPVETPFEQVIKQKTVTTKNNITNKGLGNWKKKLKQQIKSILLRSR